MIFSIVTSVIDETNNENNIFLNINEVIHLYYSHFLSEQIMIKPIKMKPLSHLYRTGDESTNDNCHS